MNAFFSTGQKTWTNSEKFYRHYFSTYCIHEDHENCRLNCKTCNAPCRCDCHLSSHDD